MISFPHLVKFKHRLASSHCWDHLLADLLVDASLHGSNDLLPLALEKVHAPDAWFFWYRSNLHQPQTFWNSKVGFPSSGLGVWCALSCFLFAFFGVFFCFAGLLGGCLFLLLASLWQPLPFYILCPSKFGKSSRHVTKNVFRPQVAKRPQSQHSVRTNRFQIYFHKRSLPWLQPKI